jgi:serine/threonine-protein kinase
VTGAPATTPQRLGRYVVEGELGRGAMGVVYLAKDEALHRTVAIKCIALGGDGHERDLHEGRFRQEARAAGSLSHPSIITVYDVGREDDIAFIAMEVVKGRELRDLLRAGEVGSGRAVEIAIHVAEALAFAHERGIVHRDIKPGNIMVLDDGRIKIMDFGIARLQEPTVKTQTGVLLGSPQYMSPEQVSGQSLDGRADIFSLGVVLYEMLTGIKPFDAPDLTQVLFWVVNMPAKPPSERRPGLPPVLDFIIARALRKKPEDRYANAAELADELRKALPEVIASESARSGDGTQPDSGATPTVTQPMVEVSRKIATLPAPGEERLELRPSRRFDATEGMARLFVVPHEGDARAGWSIPVAPLRRRFDRASAVLLAAYGAAILAAAALIVL